MDCPLPVLALPSFCGMPWLASGLRELMMDQSRGEGSAHGQVVITLGRQVDDHGR